MISQYKNNDDGFLCFRLLSQELTRLGLGDDAEKILEALSSGSTGSECLGIVGQTIVNLRDQQHMLSVGTLSVFIAPCVDAVRQAWPDYK